MNVILIVVGCLVVFVVVPMVTGLCIHAGMCDEATGKRTGRRMS